jgi:hypothetical protein
MNQNVVPVMTRRRTRPCDKLTAFFALAYTRLRPRSWNYLCAQTRFNAACIRGG